MYSINYHENYCEITDIAPFSLSKTLDCGQCFRFYDSDGFVCGVASGRYLKARQIDPNTLLLYVPRRDVPFWCSYLALDDDYSTIESSLPADDTTRKALFVSSGIRILRQERWEALCSFIISQNNNIPRIKKLVEALCTEFGDPIETPDGIFYSFPKPHVISALSEETLLSMKFGFRASYILSAAKKICLEPDFLDRVDLLPTSSAAELLTEIRGVGPKVASCTLLFGFNKTDAFPIDVWVKKILLKYYPALSEKNAASYFGEYAGIAQQYLFYYERYVISRASD